VCGVKTNVPKIAIVDDDASIRRALSRFVRSLKLQVETYASAIDFLQRFESFPGEHPDCLILDLRLPVMNGLELQTRLAGSQIPIIFISAHDDAGARDKALAAGALAFLRKPFDLEVLVQSINAALS
jgi:FixJ family two-component response regulator